MSAKRINSHLSSAFHYLVNDILTNNQMKVIKQDIDLIKLKDDRIVSIIELKTSKWPHKKWKPFIRSNFPTWSQNRLDDPNYYALAKLCELLDVEFELFKTDPNNSLESGIKRYKIRVPYENRSSDFQLVDESISFNDFIDEHSIENYESIDYRQEMQNYSLSERQPIINVKDSSNPNVSMENNLYSAFYNNEILNTQYYIEREGFWTMLISDAISGNPKWIYLELDATNSADIDNYSNFDNLETSINDDQWMKHEFAPAIEMSLRLSIPLSIISVATTEDCPNPEISAGGEIDSIKVWTFSASDSGELGYAIYRDDWPSFLSSSSDRFEFIFEEDVGKHNFEEYYCKMITGNIADENE